MSKSIYTVTAILLKESNTKESIVKTLSKLDTRCFGFFFDLDEALASVNENRCDMHECYYNYLVVEEFDEGIHPRCNEIDWWRWTDVTNSWQVCAKPDSIDNVFSYAIG